MTNINRHLEKRGATIAGLMLMGCAMLSANAGQFLANINTDKAAYSPGNGVTFYVDLTNSTASPFNGSVSTVISHLGYVTTNLPSQAITSLAAHSTTTKVFSWTPPTTDYQGYLVSISVTDGGSVVVDKGSSAVDVSSDWSKFPRYGYVSQFGAALDAYNTVWQLKNYHLNALQFYDWQWKHHVPYNPSNTWPDIANRTISRATVTNFIAAAHNYGLLAMNYNSYGMAYSNYLSDGSGVTLAMGIYSTATASLANQYNYLLPGSWATPRLYQMNNRDTNWQNFIYGQEQTVFTNFAFDGWHIDTVGQHTAYDAAGNLFTLDDYNPDFINKAKAALGKRMTFNTVDAVGENQIAQSANVDVLYSELWAGNGNYVDFKTRVDNARSYGSKAPVFPAYMNYNKTSGNFNDAGIRLADAAIFACGASHLEIGDDTQMLRTEYFPENTVKMSAALKSTLRVYYDFLVGYQNLLREGTVSANYGASITGVTTSTNGSAGSVWLISRKNLGNNLLQLINLLNNTSASWRDTNGTYAAPSTQTNLAVKMYYSGTIGAGKLWWASPDTNSGAATQLTFTNSSDGGGSFVTFTVPSLQYWDMVWLELNGTISATAQVQAENYDSMAGIATETTGDTGGGLDVGYIKNFTGDSYVAFNNIDFGTGATNLSARVASAVANGIVEFRLGSPTGTLIATVPVGNTGGWQSWQTVNASVSGAVGVQKVFAVFKNAEANLNWFTFPAPLPAPWVTTDIGAVGMAGTANYSGGTFSVSGSGADIEGAADAFRSVYQSAGPNSEIRARIVGVPGTDPWAKAGLMFRDSLASNAVSVAVLLTASNGVAFQRRSSTGGGTTSTVISGVPVPRWVRLVRTGTNNFSGYYSTDGSNWTPIGTAISLTMSNSALAGLAVTAHNNALLNTSTFDSVTLNQSPVLAAISNYSLIAGALLAFTNSATDPDVPVQTFAFSLINPPSGATLNTNTGGFNWRPAIAQSPSTQNVSVVVSDSGVPTMSATQSFSIVVSRPAPPVLGSVSNTNGQFGFWVNGDAGPDYSIQVSTNLANWSALATLSAPVPPFFLMDTNSTNYSARFYRALLGP